MMADNSDLQDVELGGTNEAKTQDGDDNVIVGDDITTEVREALELAAKPQGQRGVKPHSKSDLTQMIEEGGYEVFEPRKFKRDIPNLIKRTSRAKIYGRIPRLLVFLLIPSLFFPILFVTSNSKFPVGRMYGIALLIMFIGYYCHLYYIIFCGKPVEGSEEVGNESVDNNSNTTNSSSQSSMSLFRIYSLNSIIPYWSRMTICYRALLFKNRPIESYSEIAAIQGALPQSMTQVVGFFAWLLLIQVIALEIWSNSIRMGFGIIAILFGTFGVFLAGQFDFNPFSLVIIFNFLLYNKIVCYMFDCFKHNKKQR